MKTLASGIALGIRKAVGLPKISFQTICPVDIDPTQASHAGSTIYTVQVGAFTYIENARQRLLEAQSAGFSDAYIYQKQF